MQMRRALACLSLTPLLSLLVAVKPLPVAAAEPSPQVPQSGSNPQLDSSLRRLTQMFSPDIQNTMNACWEQGRVNLAAGAAQNGTLICGDGSSNTGVGYDTYLATVSDLLTASSLVGFRTVTETNPSINPQMLTTFLSSAEGVATLRGAVQTAITQSGLLPAQATDSTALLTDQVMEKLLPNLQDSNRIESLLGSTEQYSRVVQNFCTAPGMSVDQAKALVPDLSTIQLYAICIQESGTMNEVLRMMR